MDAAEQISRAIDILDGNAKPVDFTDPTQPELLRKVSEHVAAFERLNDSIHD